MNNDFLKLSALVGRQLAKDLLELRYGYSDEARVEVAKWLLPFGYYVEQ